MVITRKKDGQPRRTVDLADLSKLVFGRHIIREAHLEWYVLYHQERLKVRWTVKMGIMVSYLP